MNELEIEIKQTLHCEKASYEGCGSNDDIIKGWVEALEYVLRQIKPKSSFDTFKCDEDEEFISKMEGEDNEF